MFIIIGMALCTGTYLLTAAGSSVVLWQFHLKVNSLEARTDWFAKLIIIMIGLFWPCILLVALINKSLYEGFNNKD